HDPALAGAHLGPDLADAVGDLRDRALDEDLVRRAQVRAPVDVVVGQLGEGTPRVEHDEDVVGGGALLGEAAAGGDVHRAAHPGERGAVPGGERGDRADAGDHLVVVGQPAE